MGDHVEAGPLTQRGLQRLDLVGEGVRRRDRFIPVG
jgi:hypothetical protein